MRCLALLVTAMILAPLTGDLTITLRGPFRANAAAVAETTDGRLVGVLADVFTTLAPAQEGTGGAVFLDTRPLMELDMQGSARVAVRVAATIAGRSPNEFDVFFAVRTESPVIGGPSAGALLAVSALAAMTNHSLKEDVVLTGAVLPDGTVTPVGGIPEKAEAAARAGKRLFLFPAGQEVVSLRGGGSVDMVSYCRDTLSLQCRSVATVEEAFAYLTGVTIETPPVDGAPDTGASERALRPAADALLANATARRDEAAAAVANASFTGPLAEYARTSLERVAATLAAAEKARDEGRYYTTASKSFQTSVEARTLVNVARWHAAGETEAAVAEAAREGERAADRAFEAASSARPTSIAQIAAVGAAQTRAREALELVAQARASQQPLAQLRSAATAVERASTVHWWLEMGREFRGDESPDTLNDLVAEAADRAIEAAAESVAYANALLESSGAQGVEADPQDLVGDARAALEDNLAPGALFTALEADVRAGLPFALADPAAAPSALDRARERAAASILASRGAGIEPILAVSYLEFADSLRNETPPDVDDAYVFYQLARAAGRLPDVLETKGRAGETRFAPFVDDAPRLSVPASWMPAYFAFGAAVGGLVALVVLVSRSRDGEGPP